MKIFKECYPDLCLPPQPVITRWGTWLEAAQYYYENFGKIKDIILKLDSDSTAAVEKAKSLIVNPSLKNDLAYISLNAVFLAHAITKIGDSEHVVSRKRFYC